MRPTDHDIADSDATSPSGSVSWTLDQVDYAAYRSAGSKLSLGVQQPMEFQVARALIGKCLGYIAEFPLMGAAATVASDRKKLKGRDA